MEQSKEENKRQYYKYVMLFLMALVGTAVSYTVINTWIVQMTFGQYIIIEIILVMMFELFIFAKRNFE